MTDTVTVSRERLSRMVRAIDMLIPTLPGLNDKGRTWLRDEIIESTDALRSVLEQPVVNQQMTTQPAPEPVGYEQCKAIQESERNAAETNYFKARPQIDCIDRRNVFCAGFDRGFDAQKPAPVREPAPDWLPMCTAPKDGTLVLLLVDFDTHATADGLGPHMTIGSNTSENDKGLDEWQFAGWDWCFDTYTQATGTPVGWLPMPAHAAPVREPAPEKKGLFVDLIAEHPGLAEELAAMDVPAPVQDQCAELVEYILQDDIHNRLTPRVVDIAYSAWYIGRSGKNKDDGGPCDWFNDTKPMVMKQLAKIKKDMAEKSLTIRQKSGL